MQGSSAPPSSGMQEESQCREAKKNAYEAASKLDSPNPVLPRINTPVASFRCDRSIYDRRTLFDDTLRFASRLNSHRRAIARAPYAFFRPNGKITLGDPPPGPQELKHNILYSSGCDQDRRRTTSCISPDPTFPIRPPRPDRPHPDTPFSYLSCFPGFTWPARFASSRPA